MDNSRESGDLDDDTYLVLDRLLHFPHQDVDHAMVPRSRTDVVEPSTTIAEVRELMASNHTRYPVIDDDHNPVGVVHLFDEIGRASCREGVESRDGGVGVHRRSSVDG